MSPINFSVDNENDPYFIFSNFYLGKPIEINNVKFKTPQHYYQWMKFDDPIIKQRILNAPTAKSSIQLAKDYHYLINPNFYNNESGFMLNALRAKFSQNPIIGNELKNTKRQINAYIDDKYWSDGNEQLGIKLMQVRSELQNGALSFSNPYK